MGYLLSGAAYSDYGTKRSFCHFSRARRRAPLHPKNSAAASLARAPANAITQTRRAAARATLVARKPALKHTLESLPPDLLFQIFCHVGVGECNQLHLANRRMHSLFSHPRPWVIDMVVGAHYSSPLNVGVEKWRRRVERRTRRLAPDDEARARAKEDLSVIGATPRAIDVRFFRLRLVTSETVEHVARRGALVLDAETIESEQAQRVRLLQFHLHVLKQRGADAEREAEREGERERERERQREIPVGSETEGGLGNDTENHQRENGADNEPTDSSSDPGRIRAERELAARFGVLQYSPARASVCVPPDMYRRVNARKLGVVLLLHEHFGMALDGGQILAAVVDLAIREARKSDRIRHYDQETNELGLEEGGRDVIANEFEGGSTRARPVTTVSALEYIRTRLDPPAVALLAALARVREALFAVPLAGRSSLPLALVVDAAQNLADASLRRLYADEGDDELVWPLLQQLQIPELTDLAIDLGGTPVF